MQQFCSWFPSEFIQTLSKCNKVVCFDDRDFLEFNIVPALKQKNKFEAVYHIGKNVFYENQYGLVFNHVKNPQLERQISRFLGSGILSHLREFFL